MYNAVHDAILKVPSDWNMRGLESVRHWTPSSILSGSGLGRLPPQLPSPRRVCASCAVGLTPLGNAWARDCQHGLVLGNATASSNVPGEGASPVWSPREWGGLNMAKHAHQPSGLRGEFREKDSGKLVRRSLNPGEWKAATRRAPQMSGALLLPASAHCCREGGFK